MNWGVIIVVAGFVIHLNLVGLLYSYNLLHIQLKDSFNSTATEAGLPGSISIAIYAASSLPVTWVFQRIGNRPAGLLGILICCFSLLSSSFIHRIWLLYLTYGVLYGLGCNAIHLVTIDLIMVYFKDGHSARSIGIILTGSSVGVLLSPCLEWLYTTYNWRVTLRILSTLFAVICIPCIAVFRDIRKKHSKLSSTTSKEKLPEELPRKDSLLQKYFHLLRRSDFHCMMSAYAMTGIATTFSYISIGSYLQSSGMAGSAISLTFSLMAVGDLVARIVLSIISDWLPMSLTSQYAIMHIMSALSTVFLPYIFNLTFVKILLIVFGISRGGLFVLLTSAPIEIAPKNLGVEGVGLAYLIFGTCALSTPYMTDKLYDITGSYDSAFFICSALYIFAAIILFLSAHLKWKKERNTYIDSNSEVTDRMLLKQEEVTKVTVV
ncbi:monocarboxylate transporter 13-like isoform X2 [Anneissia japonica]|uniref:monocarboxylate transporter 13-like isoform X1 n=1 Tax=Anneissia japonica TaxID=1529436 RepID=UPI0014258431|nr:monocarboxylate transporter 13-like isoform X1 [Anneissia japonica]XP_033105270.1 monocarboxylate transporter 13-like isoform X2 [Anneissia japonica]